MERSHYLANRLREVLLNGRWIANTNYKEQLEATNWKQATHQIADLNTIAALTFHINYYLVGLLKVFVGDPLEIRDKYSFDSPPIQSETDWEQLRNAFLSNSEKFATAVERIDDARLNEPFVEESTAAT